MNEFIQNILDNPLAALLVIGNLIVIESLLSVDNAAVLATMVMDLPKQQRNKALRYGIIGAYVFRGLCLIFAAFLVKIWWLKPLGGIYLLWLAIDQFKDDLRIGERGSNIFKILTMVGFALLIQTQAYANILSFVNVIGGWFGGEWNLNWQFDFYNWLTLPLLGIYAIYLVYSTIKLSSDAEDDGEINKSNNRVYKFFKNKIGIFWSTVILVEIMDLAFSIDNVFAAVAFSKNILIIMIGVFIGILAMRFVAQGFVKLMEKYKFLEGCAFLVIAILGCKLLFSIYAHHFPCATITKFMEGDSGCFLASNQPVPQVHQMVWGDIITSILTVAIFFLPVLGSLLFNFPRANKIAEAAMEIVDASTK